MKQSLLITTLLYCTAYAREYKLTTYDYTRNGHSRIAWRVYEADGNHGQDENEVTVQSVHASRYKEGEFSIELQDGKKYCLRAYKGSGSEFGDPYGKNGVAVKTSNKSTTLAYIEVDGANDMDTECFETKGSDSTAVETSRIYGTVEKKEKRQLEPVYASVVCYDIDATGANEFMASGVTSTSTGKYDISYNKNQKFDIMTNADVMCIAEPPAGETDSFFPFYSNVEHNHDPDRNLVRNMEVLPNRGGQCKPNGCGSKGTEWVPEYRFHDVCNSHDCCYETCGETQKSCDSEFYSNMRSRCRQHYFDKTLEQQGETLRSCYSIAYTYYMAVAILGEKTFEEAQRDAGCYDYNDNYWARHLEEEEKEVEESFTNLLPEVFIEDDGFHLEVEEAKVDNAAQHEKNAHTLWLLSVVVTSVLGAVLWPL